MVGSKAGSAFADEIGPFGARKRRNRAARIRQNAAYQNYLIPVPDHATNGDEQLFSNKIGSYSKGLPHDSRGEVDLAAYGTLIHALTTGDPADFEAITMGCQDSTHQVKLTNPQAGLAFDLEGTDSHQLALPPAPRFDSAEEAGEIVENYWMALLRDASFTDFASNSLASQAAEDLSRMSDFRGLKSGGQVTPNTLFRGTMPGCELGPYISQFLWKNCPFGVAYVEQRMRTPLDGTRNDFMTDFHDWLEIQNGCVPANALTFDPVRRFIRNGRDLGQWVHIDVLYQAYFHAMLIMLTPPDPSDALIGGGIGARLNPGNPYVHSRTQDGFGTFGGPHFAAAPAEVATRALKAVWYQKWFVHRRLRPEEFAGRLHVKLTQNTDYPIHGDVLNSAALTAVHNRFGTYLLPLAFAEGCPTHPAYGAGHATVAGACVTILKALFDEHFVIPNPVVPSPDGLTLVPYTGADAEQLTVGGELNKLAANVAIGRNIAGVHWRSDATESLKLGEAVAISILRDQKLCFNENFSGFTFTKFDGTRITI
ncbi:MAG: vanadium-dependent haloperoxidase [Planctomycetes bacterium]|nr:vanadium-dependent haloperoxidase [Planctomycetota bacterium]